MSSVVQTADEQQHQTWEHFCFQLCNNCCQPSWVRSFPADSRPVICTEQPLQQGIRCCSARSLWSLQQSNTQGAGQKSIA